MDPETRYNFITRNLSEVIGEDELRAILQERNPKIYWGTAPTGVPHMGYLVPMMKIADMLQAECDVTILFADIHAMLDNMKSTPELVAKRTEFYEFLIKCILRRLNVPLDKLRFIRGSSFQTSSAYVMKLYELAAQTTIKNAMHVGAEVVKQSDNPLLSCTMYPLLQALDEEFLEVDIQIGGLDQRHIMMFARDSLPKVGIKKRIHLMNPLIPGLTKSGKMSSSIPNSKIDYMDSDADIHKKIMSAYSVDKQIDTNCLLALMKNVIFPYLNGQPFSIRRDEMYGGDITIHDYEELVEAFTTHLSSVDLKTAMVPIIQELIRPIREDLLAHMDLYRRAYPIEECDDAPSRPSRKRKQIKKQLSHMQQMEVLSKLSVKITMLNKQIDTLKQTPGNETKIRHLQKAVYAIEFRINDIKLTMS